MCGAELVLLLLSVSSLGVTGQEVEVVRCANLGQLYHPETRSCHPPLSRGPCGEGRMVVLDTTSLLGRCVERKCEDRDTVWDEETGQCEEMFGRPVSVSGREGLETI